MAFFVALVAPVRNRISRLLCGQFRRLIILGALPPLLKYLIELRVIVLVPRLHDGIAQYASPQAVALLTPDRNAFYVNRRCIRRAGKMLSGEQLVMRSYVRLVTFDDPLRFAVRGRRQFAFQIDPQLIGPIVVRLPQQERIDQVKQRGIHDQFVVFRDDEPGIVTPDARPGAASGKRRDRPVR
ncbi:hypothetical protein QFZ96_005332 [Paraburkholderia youngii]